MPVPAGGGVEDTFPCGWDLDVGCCDGWSGYSTDLQNASIAFSSMILWASTGRQYSTCETTVRPCGKTVNGSWSGAIWGWGPGSWNDGASFVPYQLNGGWFNCGCMGGCASCAPSCQVLLPGPVNRVIRVTQDSSIVDPTAYRVDNGKWLVRTDGDCWPAMADLDVNSGTGFFEVKYEIGTPPPDALLRAAGTLACEYAKSCLGQDCRLPQRVQSIIRQGVQITMTDVDSLLMKGLTGLQDVDQIIMALNPFALKSRPRLYSPDMDLPRVVTA